MPTKSAAKPKPAAKPSRRDMVLGRDTFLRSQGPKVVEVTLPMLGLTALMRRVDMLALAQSGEFPQPITGRLLTAIRQGGVTTESLDDDNIVDTMKTAEAVARACIIVPPDEYLDGTIGVDEIDPTNLLPLFVEPGVEPLPGQVALDYVSPDEDPSGDNPEAGRLHWRDLAQILSYAYLYGGGGLGRTFRGG